METSIGPVANPVAEVQIGVTGIAVADKSFVMASAGAKRPGEAGVAIIFAADVTASQEGALLLAIDSGADVAKSMLVRVHETVAGCDIARGADADEAETSAAGV